MGETNTTQLKFTERMSGWFSRDGATYEASCKDGKAKGTTITFVVSIAISDLERAIRDSSTPAKFTGHLDAPAVSGRPMEILDGTFQLMVPDPDHVETYNMRYRMTVRTVDGVRYQFDGIKVIKHGLPWHAWKATTTLFVTLQTADGPAPGDVVGRGIMTIPLVGFLKLLRTVRVTGAKGFLGRARAKSRFGTAFMGRLLPIYAGEFAEHHRFSEQALGPGKSRPLRLPEPTTIWCDGAKQWHEGKEPGPDAWLRLTRYQGGPNGPLVLAPGFAMQAHSFALPTVDTNLTEYAVEHGYDVWLLDYRASIKLPSSQTPFTIDDVATVDWPEAVAEVRRRTGADSVQVLGHCVGSVSILMAMLAGLEGVRSIACSQFTTQTVTSRLNRTKNALNMGAAMQRLHMKGVKPGNKPTLANKGLDVMLRFLPYPNGERCGLPICRWINAIFGLTHNHAQLNEATHDAFATEFGFANVSGLNHLALMARKGHAVDHLGREVYLTHPERLAVPILFIQGLRNHIFRPAGTRKTVEWLSKHNDPALYRMLELPEYAHLDAMTGRDAHVDVFPGVFEHFVKT